MNRTDASGRTALHVASSAEVVTLLLKNRDIKRYTAILAAFTP